MFPKVILRGLAVVALGTAIAAVAQEDQDGSPDEAQGESNATVMDTALFTSEYVLVRNETSGAIVDTTNDKAVVAGKRGGSLTPGTAADECGTYWNGSSYTTSSIWTGALNETALIVSSGVKSARIPMKTYFKGTLPNPGKHFVSFSLHKEHVSDDATCIQSSTTYTKYSVSMD